MPLASGAAFLAACDAELDALKPGNVHRYAGGHGMAAADFERSARAAAAPLTLCGARVGARVRAAVEATWAAVGCNTNLGIVLLCAPLAAAAEQAGAAAAGAATADPSPAQRETALRLALHDVLARLDLADAADAYAAIARANPGGLGAAPEQDVRQAPAVDLRAAMALAQERDRIARQYVTDFADVFESTLPALRSALADSDCFAQAVGRLYLFVLASWPDSHILRKFGDTVAHSVSSEARDMQASFPRGADSERARIGLLDWDAQLKSRGINPGTSADLTVATVFAYLLAGGKAG